MTCFIPASLHRARAGVLRSAITFSLCALLAGCGPGETASGSSTSAPTTDGSQPDCTGADVALPDGRCQPPGLPLDMPCPPGETPLPDGTCQAAGVPPSECGEGFAPDGEGGCAPVLPMEPCPDGTMAVPGETECHEVGSCGAGKWGDIPVDATTQFVDGSYAGQDSDGSEQKPWTTLQAALLAAPSGGIVAVAAGTYAEDVHVEGSPVKVWGVCPAQVTLQGVSSSDVAFGALVSGVELHGVHVTGPHLGVYASKFTHLLVEDVWIEGTQAEALVGDAHSNVTVRRSLFEHTTDFSVNVAGGDLLIERSVLRDVTTGPQVAGIHVNGFTAGFHRATLTVRSSLLERADLAGVNTFEADVTLDGVAVRTISPDTPGGLAPRGGLLAGDSTADVRRSTFEGVPLGIILSGSKGVVEHCTFTDGAPIPPQYKTTEAGISVQRDPATFTLASLDLRASRLARLPQFALGINEATVTVESTLVQDTPQKDPEGSPLRGIQATLTLSTSVVTGSRHSALSMEGSAVVVEASRISGVEPTTHAGKGIGIFGYIDDQPADASLVLRSSVVEDCYEAGIAAIEADVTVETSIVRNVKARTTDGLFGDGFVLMAADPTRGSGTITGSLFQGVARAGIAAFGSRISMGNSASVCAIFPLAGEAYQGVPFSFEKTADNACGCPDPSGLCKVDSPGLAPPPVQ